MTSAFFGAFLVSFGVVFIAELGDKSQLMALTFATRFRPLTVIAAISVATALVHVVSVAVGSALGDALPERWILLATGVAYLLFAGWTLRGDRLSEREGERAGRVRGSVFLAVSAAFLLAEFGDKTMLATVTLATNHDWLGTWLGSTVGMVVADGLAIVVGTVVGRRLPQRLVSQVAAGVFVVVATTMLVSAGAQFHDSAPSWTKVQQAQMIESPQ